MSILLFSGDSVLYKDSDNGAIRGILIPRYSNIKKYADITSPNDSTVKLRHGDADDLPTFWRSEGPYVYVYGNISLELDEKRSSQAFYLPQDFIGDDVGAFYYVIGDKYIIHGVKSITDDGQKIWGTSLIGHSDETIVDTVVSSLSERMLEGKEEKIIVAVHNNDDIKNELSEALTLFEQEVVDFESLGVPDKNIKPLFARKDKSLLMLVVSLCVLIAMGASLFIWINGKLELSSQENKITKLQSAIRKMQKNKDLGYIKNPKEVLTVMDKTLPLPPSTLIASAGKVAKMFGEVKEVKIGSSSKKSRGVITDNRNKKIYEINAKVNFSQNSLLLDQERIAKKVVDTLPWVKYIERPSGNASKEIKIGVKVK